MIDLASIDNHKKEDILKLLSREQTGTYEVYIPKSTEDVYMGAVTVADDYALAAYAGQLLSDISSAFDYEKTGPELQKSIRFKLLNPDMDALATTLLHISYGYANEPEDEEFNIFEPVFDYIDEVNDGNKKPACPYFIEVFNEYATKADEEDDGFDEDEEDDDED